MLLAETNTTNTEKSVFSQYLLEAVERVETARKDALNALDTMVVKVDKAREDKNSTVKVDSISTQIVETQALADIASNTAKVEIAKANAIAKITKALDTLENATEDNRQALEESFYKLMIDAVSFVEVAKANASKHIAKATQRVEVSKTIEKFIPHAEETLSIAKNLSAVKIAKSVSEVEIAKSNSYIEIATASLKDMKEMLPTLSKENETKLSDIKADATAKISSYLTELEILRTEVEAKIAKEVARVEIVTSDMLKSKD
jgi:hypothetical protein